MNIVVLGYIIRGPLGGLAWHHFQYVLGLKKMNHTVLFLEDSDNYPSCYNPETYELTTDPDYGLAFINRFFSAYDLGEDWAYYDDHSGNWYGRTMEQVTRFCSQAELVINLSCVNPVRDWWASIPVRLLIDTDPVFTQVKHLKDQQAFNAARTHTHFATFGENFGRPSCSIPDDQLPWFPTRQPVGMELWHVLAGNPRACWTTVMQWDSYKSVEYNGFSYGMKSVTFKPYMDLPASLQDEKLEIALGSQGAPAKLLTEKGWKITDPHIASHSPEIFQAYLASSKGEWTVSKEGYLISRSGWFSERTLNYMACGRPVVIQDTGFSDFIPVGKGLLTFSGLEEAAENIKAVSTDYALHCREARNITAEYFRSDLVLGKLLNAVI